tara:strand:- start:35858 stop:36406 length:549 start_codon:yes stop_codon:yes gene_type:complete
MVKYPDSKYGKKDRVNLQAQKIEPINPESRLNITRHQQKYWKRKATYLPYLKHVPINQIDTLEKMAYFIRHHYEFGVFNVNFVDYYNKNPNYNPNKDCKDKECKFWKKNNGIKPGRGMEWKCKWHKRLWPALKPRLRITIYEKYTDDPEIDYGFSVDRKKNLMYRMWWWKGSRAEKQPVDYY